MKHSNIYRWTRDDGKPCEFRFTSDGVCLGFFIDGAKALDNDPDEGQKITAAWIKGMEQADFEAV